MKRLTLIFTLLFGLGVWLKAQTPTAPSSGNGTAGSPYQIATLNHLYWITADATRWTKHYIQTADIDAASTSSWFPIDGGGFYGWLPIGHATTKFTGTYNGSDYQISGLFINRADTANIGLFGYTSNSTITALNLTGVAISGASSVGALVGYNYNTSVSQCTSSGAVSGVVSSQTLVGGLIGNSFTSSSVDNCSSSCTVTGNENVGGLVGQVYSSSITNSFSTGTVNGYQNVGGLAGRTSASATISDSYSSASVNGSNINIGGLVGWNTGVSIIDNCYSTGLVTGTGTADTNGIVGGLVGENYSISTASPSVIRNSNSSSVVSGSFRCGGLVGRNNNSTIENCYSSGNVTGRTYTGGFVGANTGSNADVSNCYSTGNTTSSTSHCGGFAGWNGSSANIQNSFSRGNVKRSSGGTAAQFGGFAGYNESDIAYSYSTGKVEWLSSAPVTKGFCGAVGATSNMISCFWDTETSQQTSSAGTAIGQTSAQMQSLDIYSTWDFTTIWTQNPNINNSYPYLQSNPVDITLPVELSSFLGIYTAEGNVRLDWISQSETGVSGYYVFRGLTEVLASSSLISALIPATNSSGESRYSFTDTELLESGTYYYWLQNIDLDGSHSYYGPVAVVTQEQENPLPSIPIFTGINSAYPNPFNPVTFISYSLKDASDVSIQIFNLKGQLTAQWQVAKQTAGTHRLRWDANDLPSGVYFVKFTAGKKVETRRLTLMK